MMDWAEKSAAFRKYLALKTEPVVFKPKRLTGPLKVCGC